jgi:DNA-directed RNA polymerase delta subunit
MYDKGNIIQNQNIMVEGQLIKSANGRFYAKIRDDGNFCEVNKKYWAFSDAIIKIF